MIFISVLLAALLPSLAPAGSLRARVWLADRSPLVVRGSGFAAAERVTVTITGAGRFVRTVTATRAGVIIVRWTSSPTAKASCAVLAIRAAGSRGTVATAKVPGLECAQPPQDPGP